MTVCALFIQSVASEPVTKGHNCLGPSLCLGVDCVVLSVVGADCVVLSVMGVDCVVLSVVWVDCVVLVLWV